MIVKTKAPTRIDLAGGTLDLWPIHQLIPRSCTVNVGVSLFAEVSVKVSHDNRFHIMSEDLNVEEDGTYQDILVSKRLPLFSEILRELWHKNLPPLSIVTTATSPAGAGLGGSSCLSLALVRALLESKHLFGDGKAFELTDHQLVAVVRDIEARLIWAPTGVQDYWGALRGSLNLLTFPAGETNVETLIPSTVVGLEEQLMLCYSGKSRASAGNNWQVYKALLNKDEFVLQTLKNIALKATECAAAIKIGDLGTALLISKAEWEERKKLWPDIVTRETEKIESEALSAGAYFSRVCGAGGGGVLAVFAPLQNRDAVKRAVTECGGVVLDAKVAGQGLQCFHDRS